ncbi:MAG: hypothetical protein FJX67_02595 [Alphaproteobacteria bacterium]|nr:hypothetical protein [Alphaproteobacteria bacterium]
MALAGRSSRAALEAASERLYAAIVAQARQPGFYLAGGVPDTVDGRFDLIALHAFLVLRRLKDGRPAAAPLSQALFDLLFTDMDRSLREMGAGDLGVGRRVKAMAKAFYGRIAAYEEGLAKGGVMLDEAIGRNLFRGEDVRPEALKAIAAYLEREAAALVEQRLDDLLVGTVRFGPAPGDGAVA